MKFAAGYSFGKDSALAFWRTIQAGHQPVCLIVTVNEEAGRTWFHGIDHSLMDRAAESMGVPLIKCPCAGEGYIAAFEKGLTQAKKLGAEACVFGDIDIEGHLEWNRQRCAAAGLDCLVPLWKEGREAMVLEMIDAGFKAAIKCIKPEYFDDSFLGQTMNRDMVEKIRATGADVCGENGEYHTFVYDGPTFGRPVEIQLGEILKLEYCHAVDIS